MTHLGAAAFGIAATASLLIVYIGRPAAPPPAGIEHQAPMIAEGKSDRLPLPELPAALLNLPGTAEGRTQDAAIPGATRESKEAAPMTVVRAVGAASTRLDPVCGPRGRTWYTKDNGYRYWKCVR